MISVVLQQDLLEDEGEGQVLIAARAAVEGVEDANAANVAEEAVAAVIPTMLTDNLTSVAGTHDLR
jgi:hypothetical protein